MKKVLFTLAFILAFSNVKALELNSKNVILINLNDNNVIYKQDSEEIISIASLTKIMTVITAIENIYDFNSEIVIKNKDFYMLYELDASLAGFSVGDRVTYNDLLYGTFLPSGADAAQALANNIAGSVPAFVDLMNKKVKEIGLNNSHFSNVSGLDDVNHYSTVSDVAKLLIYALKNEKFKEIFLSKKYITSNNLYFTSTFWYTASKYNYDMNFVNGAKTGFTDDAGRCLASTATDSVNNINYLLVTCGAPDSDIDAYHVKDAYNIYQYYFNNFKYQTLVSNGDKLVTLKTRYSKDKEITFNSNENIKYYLNNDYDKNLIKVEYNGIDVIDNHYKNGDKLGVVSIYYDNLKVKDIDIILENQYKFSFLCYLIETKLIYVISSVLLVLIGIIIFILKKHK